MWPEVLPRLETPVQGASPMKLWQALNRRNELSVAQLSMQKLCIALILSVPEQMVKTRANLEHLPLYLACFSLCSLVPPTEHLYLTLLWHLLEPYKEPPLCCGVGGASFVFFTLDINMTLLGLCASALWSQESTLICSPFMCRILPFLCTRFLYFKSRWLDHCTSCFPISPATVSLSSGSSTNAPVARVSICLTSFPIRKFMTCVCGCQLATTWPSHNYEECRLVGRGFTCQALTLEGSFSL